MLRRAVEQYRQGGPTGLLRACRKRLRYTLRYAVFGVERALLTDRQWYEYTLWRNRRGVSAAADPRQLRYVDPTRIRRASPFNPRFCWQKLGQVRGGDWDRDCQRLDDRFDDVFGALEARYVDGTPWEEVDLPHAVADGDRERWHFATGDDVWEWVEDLDALYESIRDRGYLPVREILDMDFEEAADTDYGSLSERFRPVANGSLFFVERDGDFQAVPVHRDQAGQTRRWALPDFLHRSGLTVTPDARTVIYVGLHAVASDLLMIDPPAEPEPDLAVNAAAAARPLR